MSNGFPESSYAFRKHLPNLMRPYFAEVISTTWPGLHWARKVSQLQYSLTTPESKILTL